MLVFGAQSSGLPDLTLNSVVLDGVADYMSRTFAAGNRRKWTLSMWTKKMPPLPSATQTLWSSVISGGNDAYLFWTTAGALQFWTRTAAARTGDVTTIALYRDPTAWLHIVLRFDADNATAADRVIIEVNGVRQALTITTQQPINTDGQINAAGAHYLGNAGSSSYIDGLIANIDFVDGLSLASTSFGRYDADSGGWEPAQYTGSYGTTGFHLSFSNTGSLGTDSSGNSNTWTLNSLSSSDASLDSPTKNFCTFNTAEKPTVPTITNGGRTATGTSATAQGAHGTFLLKTGKWYCEAIGNGYALGVQAPDGNVGASISVAGSRAISYWETGTTFWDGGSDTAPAAFNNTTDVIAMALDMDAGTVQFFKNNVSQGTWTMGVSTVPDLRNTGCYITFHNGGVASKAATINFGATAFVYTPPTGFNAVHTRNLPAVSVLKSSKGVKPLLFTGNGAVRSITGAGHQPDLVWIKNRSQGDEHKMVDSVRGATKELSSDSTNAEQTDANGVTAFGTDGFSLGTGANGYNDNAELFVAWLMKKSPDYGFDIVSFTGNATNRTIAHGLGKTPKFIIVKNLTDAAAWRVYHVGMGPTVYMALDVTTVPATSSTAWNDTAPTSSVFSVGTSNESNGSGDAMIAYVFADIPGFSDFGTYVGNGDAIGPYVNTGFRPAWLILKRYDASGGALDYWHIYDGARSPENDVAADFSTDASTAEITDANSIDRLANGFKFRDTETCRNASGATYIYMAFSEKPFGGSNTNEGVAV